MDNISIHWLYLNNICTKYFPRIGLLANVLFPILLYFKQEYFHYEMIISEIRSYHCKYFYCKANTYVIVALLCKYFQFKSKCVQIWSIFGNSFNRYTIGPSNQCIRNIVCYQTYAYTKLFSKSFIHSLEYIFTININNYYLLCEVIPFMTLNNTFPKSNLKM